MSIRLFYIEPPECKNAREVIPGIFVVAQLEQELYPFIRLNYLPYNQKSKGGVIIVTKNETIRKDYEFTEKSFKSDLNDLRNVLWSILEKQENIVDMTKPGARNYTTFKVTDSWKQKLNQLENDKCWKLIINTVTDATVRYNILSDQYRLSPIDKQDRNICKRVRGEECNNNFPSGSALNAVCLSNVEWLCNTGYPVNKPALEMAENIQKVRSDLMEKLKKSGYKVNKRFFDEIISAGLFTSLGERLRNKNVNLDNVKGALADMFLENGFYQKMINHRRIERFNEDNNNYLWIFILFIVIIMLLYFYKN